ncbi:MAG: dipeptide epimerase [Planctomycetes bacterium]|nr:dipeptide epimerase [Planctomycetota bacterium]
MRIARVETWLEHFPLLRPYTIAFRTIAAVDNVIVRIVSEDGRAGLGAASPEAFVTGETLDACRQALAEEALAWLAGQDVRELPRLCREAAARLRRTPAALAAIDVALHDLLAQHLGLPLADCLGRAHERLLTSITIGIKPVAETVEEAREYVGRGFRVLKVKCGHSLDEDVARLRRLREILERGVALRVDPNQGYTFDQVLSFCAQTKDLDVEFIEQPLKANAWDELRALPADIRRRVAADEMLLSEGDALRLVAPPPACGIFNIKLMKCGGIRPALRIAAIAEAAGVSLMWGCMDESVISITAALHAAFASPATRYLDLDGSLDLARDVVAGGFVLEEGWMRTPDAPGLGVRQLS